MNSLRTRIINRRCIKNIIQLQNVNISNFTSEEIKIPMRIERSATDILRALDSTVSRDPTAADYKYMDDPHFIPRNEIMKRMFLLSKESGIRAARWIIKTHGDLFKSDLSQPPIQAFVPPENYTEKSQVSNEILLNLIRVGSFNDAFHVYNLLEKNVPLETKQALLEILCYYNGEIIDIAEYFPGEQKYASNNVINSNVWSENSEITSLFNELKNDDKFAKHAYNAMICGTAKYLNIEKALQLYDECVKKNIPVAAKTYCYLIPLSRSLKSNFNDCSMFIENYLKTMVDNGISMNLEIFISILKCISGFADNPECKGYTINLANKFKSLGISPSLGVYYYLLLIFYPKELSGGSTSEFFENVLNEVEMKEFTMQHQSDLDFFPYAMSVIRHNYFETELAHRLHKIFLSKNNFIFLHKASHSNSYYSFYHRVVLQNEPFESFVKFYDSFVPHIFIPDAYMMRSIMESFIVNKPTSERLETLTKFLSDIVKFESLYNNSLLKTTYQIIDRYKVSNAAPHIQQKLAEYAWSTWSNYTGVRQKVKYNFTMNANTFSTLMHLLLNADQYEQFLDVVSNVVQTPTMSDGVIKISNLKALLDKCILKKQANAAMILMEYLSNNYVFDDLSVYARKILSQLTLDEQQIMILQFMLERENYKDNKKLSNDTRIE